MVLSEGMRGQPPRAVRMPRAFSASAIARVVDHAPRPAMCPNTLAAITVGTAGFRSLSAEAAMDHGSGNDAVAAIGGSLILLWISTPVLVVLLLTWMFLLRSPRRRPGGADEQRPRARGLTIAGLRNMAAGLPSRHPLLVPRANGEDYEPLERGPCRGRPHPEGHRIGRPDSLCAADRRGEGAARREASHGLPTARPEATASLAIRSGRHRVAGDGGVARRVNFVPV